MGDRVKRMSPAVRWASACHGRSTLWVRYCWAIGIKFQVGARLVDQIAGTSRLGYLSGNAAAGARAANTRYLLLPIWSRSSGRIMPQTKFSPWTACRNRRRVRDAAASQATPDSNPVHLNELTQRKPITRPVACRRRPDWARHRPKSSRHRPDRAATPPSPMAVHIAMRVLDCAKPPQIGSSNIMPAAIRRSPLQWILSRLYRSADGARGGCIGQNGSPPSGAGDGNIEFLFIRRNLMPGGRSIRCPGAGSIFAAGVHPTPPVTCR